MFSTDLSSYVPISVLFDSYVLELEVSLKAVFLSTKIEITYTSDYFQELYDLAVEFIRRGCELVDHQVLHWVVPKLYYTHCIVDSLEIITHLVKFNGTCFHIFILLLIIYC
ncbi:putative glutamine--tRNA ligase [Helianthus annuus]|nr:putative glutamine--tRNA ligase [Helianthus annuus]KAJ0552396.1 putative glutamine--tRNA ligase [Helianthus annuus]KAJ0718096.1 putative glutamine--tRNA ligase [Helianthus annuus]KAJ0721332.1 putative glutamine--tRNA ligase [Helianthus annuus]